MVTVIEVVSPTNKLPGEGLEQYRRKQRDLCRSDTNLVEIDLLRLGKHVLAVSLENIPLPQRTPYMVCVAPGLDAGKGRGLFLSPADACPPSRCRCGESTPTAARPAALIEQCYRRGRYEGDLNYAADPEPPLMGVDAQWADEMLRQWGLRAAPPRRKGKRKPPGSEER